jgi:hypothetical protein
MQIHNGQEELTLDSFLALVRERGIQRVGTSQVSYNDAGGFWDEQPHSYWEEEWPHIAEVLEDGTWEARWRKQLSGHMYLGAAHETDNSCGNCDGARCDTCVDLYSVVLERQYPVPCGKWHDGEDCMSCKGTGTRLSITPAMPQRA